MISFKYPEQAEELLAYVIEHGVPEHRIWHDGEYMRIMPEEVLSE